MVIHNPPASAQCNTPSEQSVELGSEQSRSSIATQTQPHTSTADTSHAYITQLTEFGCPARFVQQSRPLLRVDYRDLHGSVQ